MLFTLFLALLSLVAWGAHQAVVRTVRRLRRPFRLRRSSSFGLGLVCVGHCLGLLFTCATAAAARLCCCAVSLR